MCGINGFNWIDQSLIKEMNDSLKHRGPDGEGIYFDKKNQISLGHRRLAILDLSNAGSQPMFYSDEYGACSNVYNSENIKKCKVGIVYNGEVYNFLELKKELSKKGYKFTTKTDTEVILASYLEWGFDCVKKFNGMWAFCIYDLSKNLFFLSRDRVGKKPLYYYKSGNKFIFSSEIKGILKHNIKKEIDKEAVDLYFSLGFIPAPWSIYKNIFKLEARQNLIFYLKTNKIKKYYYYMFPYYEPIYDKNKLIRDINELLEDSINLRMISDVPLGAFLSGGLDSSAVVTKMSKFTNLKNLNTFSIGFEGDYDESYFAKKVSKFLSTKNTHKLFTELDFQAILDSIFYYYDEPLCDPSMFPSVYLSEITKKFVTVSLSGDGGDEIFGGYPRYKIANQLVQLRKLPLFLRKILYSFLKIFNFKVFNNLKEGIRLSFLPDDEFYSSSRQEIYKPEITKKLLKKKLKECLNLTYNELPEAIRLMDLCFYTLPDNFLAKTDRASMSKSLEVRCPFLDYRIIDYSFKIPTKFKVSKSKNKILLRKLLKGSLPKEIIKREKVGFTPPIIEWIQKPIYTNEIKKSISDLNNKQAISKNWLDFYNQILEKNDDISKNYKIRMLLFSRWYNYWVEMKN